MIKKVEEKPTRRKIEIDLTGPEGNAFFLLGKAKQFSNQLDLDWDFIHNEMTADDYEHLISVFDAYFGDFVILYR